MNRGAWVAGASLLCLGSAWAPWEPREPYRPVDPARVDGTTLCVTNPDGSALLLDAPGPAWSWYEYESGGLWFAYRSGDLGDAFRDVVSFSRIWGMPDCAVLSAEEPHPPLPDWWGPFERTCEISSLPEPGSVRLRTRWTIGKAHKVEFVSYSYYTPHGYQFISPAEGQQERAHIVKALASYRIVGDRACGPVPGRPSKRRTTTR